MTDQQLDPRTAFVGFSYVEIPLGSQCFGRICRNYCRYDLERCLPAIYDEDFRPMHGKAA